MIQKCVEMESGFGFELIVTKLEELQTNQETHKQLLEEVKQQVSTLLDQLNSAIAELKLHQQAFHQQLAKEVKEQHSASNGKQLNQARARALLSITWVPWVRHTAIPNRAVLADGGDSAYVARVSHNGDYHVVKACLPPKLSYIVLNGVLIHFVHCEMLTGSGFSWVKYSGGGASLPTNAVSCGQKANGEPQYIGRVEHRSPNRVSIRPGTIDSATKVLSIAYGAKEFKYDQYEILVTDLDGITTKQ